MVSPSRRTQSQTGGMTTRSWLTWTLLLLYSTTNAQARATSILEPLDPFLSASHSSRPPTVSRRSQAGRSPAEIPLLNHDIPTAKFRNTHNEHNDAERYPALAPAQDVSAVRAPLAQSSESSGLSALLPARQLQDWEAEDIILLSTIDGALHARDRRTGQHRWTLQMTESPMIESIHYHQNKSNLEDAQDDYMFIVEPSKDGQLFAQFSNPKIGLVRLQATVKKMATEVPFTMQVNGQYLATSSEQQSKVYTLDAESGQILHEFPKHRASIKEPPQPRCRRRNGLDFGEVACKPGRTIRLGRNTYTFTISNEQTGQDLCTIKFSEWVTNKGDIDLQSQHVSSLDGYDLQSYYNGRIIGLDASGESDRFHRYTHMLECPVARIFDVVRPYDLQDDSTDLVLLSRPMDLPLTLRTVAWQSEMQNSQRVFVNKTEAGHWYAMSELSYPGVTSGASFANIRWNYDGQQLDLQSDLSDIVGVHVLSNEQTVAPTRLTISAPPADQDQSDQMREVASMIPAQPPAVIYKQQLDWSSGIISVIVALIVAFVAGRQLGAKDRKTAAGFALQDASKVQYEADVVPQAQVSREMAPEVIQEVAAEVIEQPEMATITPTHSRAQSSVSMTATPKRAARLSDNDENATEGESDDEEEQSPDVEPAQPEEKKRKKTPRGTRGGRRKQKKKENKDKAMNPANFEPKPVISMEQHFKDGMVQVGRLKYDAREESCLGQGSSGTAVYPGTFDGRQVAVKRLVKSANSLAEKEIKHLVSSDENPHVIRYFGKEESPAFFYIALDRFAASLDQFIEFPDRHPTLISPTYGFDVKDALRQITRGVQHLHSLKLVHRDIKPQNILVRPVRTARPCPEGQMPQLLFVISDFGLCKPLEDGPESAFAPTRTAAGTTGWRAPELLVSPRAAVAAPTAESTASTRSTTHSSEGTVIDPPSGRRATKAIDIFSLGCVFYYVMTQGGHPFDKGGSSLGRDLNIKEDNFTTDLLQFHNYEFDADDLIHQMIKHEPKARPDTAGILRHPYFWTIEQKLEFICAVSDCYEREKNSITNIHDENAPRTEAELQSLEELDFLQAIAPDVIGVRTDGSIRDFLSSLPKSFLNEMGKQRKYTGTKMIDLLRVIRNKKNHFHDLPAEVKEMMTGQGQGIVEGYYGFWTKRFPSLLVNCHCLLVERDLVERFGLQRWYDGTLIEGR